MQISHNAIYLQCNLSIQLIWISIGVNCRFDAGRDNRLGLFKIKGLHQHLCVTRIRLIEQSVVSDSHDAVEDTHLFAIVRARTRATFELELKSLRHSGLNFVKCTRRPQCRKVVTVHDNANTPPMMSAATRGCSPLDESKVGGALCVA